MGAANTVSRGGALPGSIMAQGDYTGNARRTARRGSIRYRAHERTRRIVAVACHGMYMYHQLVYLMEESPHSANFNSSQRLFF